MLIFPPQPQIRGGLCPSYMQQEHAFLYPPLGILYLASNLDRAKHKIRIIDSAAMKFTLSECIDAIREFEPDILGITVLTDLLYSVKKIAEGAKSIFPNIKVIFGGPHISIYPYETMNFPGVDFCLQHFAEYSFNMLLEAIENNSGYENIPGLFYKNDGVVYKSKAIINDTLELDSLKMPDRRMLNYKKYFTVVNSRMITTAITSRGCPMQCTFCYSFHKKYLFRSAGNIIDEVKDIVKLGIKSIHFFDDNFNIIRGRVIEFCELLLKENIKIEWAFRGSIRPIDDEMAKLLYRAGCRRVQLGVESSNEDTLRIIKKKISLDDVKKAIAIYKRNKILTLGYFIIGFPHENYEDTLDSVNKAIAFGFDYIQFSVLTPYPNTEIYEQLLAKGYKDHWLEFAKNTQDNYDIPIMHPHITREALNSVVNQAYRRLYFSPRFILKELSRINNPRTLALKVKAALKIFSTTGY